ncbi:MAG: hypothetical protein A3E36_04715 [Candidatus Andersenbacteria bacterium RIFCSPHIGHO2_12_FULL_45_11b]|uniref:Uncharacterized protein n=1 Tax=Candidatus Andersenbacteria bacterium RIFCSPHIGHO2_12_FULL_45_11b TaxID=1797282 RepID=A0A1G1XE14_9BACT|nr:MAG: hypothetical protein A3E36_04715 [Candidatus Andersenbacteria bacterium RIFCSPHIGHO2_12_FULL_45_11b]
MTGLVEAAPAMRNAEYWTPDLIKKMEGATTFSELADVALTVQWRMRNRLVERNIPPHIAQVCGPISTGGTGNRALNLQRFDSAIDMLVGDGVAVFDQMPFEDHFDRITQIHGLGFRELLLPAFYGTLFAKGYIMILYFLPDWETSQGATWERNIAKYLSNIAIIDL